jgi:hypothetical protein
MPLQKALALVGVAKQTSLGTPIANPQFSHGIISGGVITVDMEQEQSPMTSAYRVSANVDRTKVEAGFDFTTRGFPKALGLWLYAALGAKSVTGAGPYTHVLTPAGSLPYLTVWGSLDGILVAVQDCVVDEIEISWDENEPPEVKVSGLGGLIDFAPTYVPVVDESLDPYLLTAGGTFKLDIDSATAVTAPIKGGSYKVANGVESIMLSGSIIPNLAYPGRQEFETSATMVPTTDLGDWRAAVTGSPTGTTASGAPVYGSVEYTFPVGTSSLKLASTRVPFAIDFPEGDAGGGAVELEATGMPVMPSGGGAAVTATLINSQATY